MRRLPDFIQNPNKRPMNSPNERNVHERSRRFLESLGGPDPDLATARGLVEDLHLYQAELETQNEELQTAQAKLEESRQRYVDIFDLAPVGYVEINRDGIIQKINLQACELLGVQRQYLQLGKSPLVGLLDGESHPDFFRILQQARTRQTHEQVEVLTPARGTSPRILRIYLACGGERNQSGTCLLCLVDVTARRKAEQALADQSERLAGQNQDLRRFNEVAVDRELRMVELKKEINELCARLGEPPRYLIGEAT